MEGANAEAARPPEARIFPQDAEWLQMALESAQIGVWEWNIKTGKIKWSNNLEAVHGMASGAFDGTFETFLSMIHPDDRSLVTEAITRSLKDRTDYSVEFRTLWPDGSIHWMSGQGKPFYNEAGEPVRMAGVGRDVTDRKQADERLRRSEQRYRLLADSMPQIAWTARPDGSLDYLNAYLTHYSGVPIEQCLDWALDTIMHPEDIQPALTRWLHSVRTGELYEAEFRIRRIDGVYRWHLARGLPMRDDQGRITQWLGTATDIEDRKTAAMTQRFLAETSALLSSSLDYEATLANVAHMAVPHLADWCAVHIVEEDGSVRPLAVAHVNPDKLRWAQELSQRYPYDPAAPTGVPNVLRTGKSEFYPAIPDELLVAAARDEEHLRIMREIGFTSAMIVPMLARGRTLGVISFVSAESGRPYTRADLTIAEDLALNAAMAMDNARLYQTAQRELSERTRAEQQQRFLAEAGTLLSGSLDYQQTLETVAQLAVPFLADLCLIDAVNAENTVQRLAWTYTDRPKQLLNAVYRYVPAAPAQPHPIEQALSTGKPVYVPDVTDAWMEEAAATSEQLALLRQLSLCSLVTAPLIAHGHSLGVLTVAFSTSGRHYTPGDVTVVERLAQKAAFAIDNARLFRIAEQEIAERQRAEEDLRQKNKQIEALNRRLQRTMSETHHRVKNNLQVISALVDMQVMKPAEVSKAQLGRIAQHIRSLASIHDLLTKQAKSDAEVEYISVPQALNKLVQPLQAMLEGRRIQLTIEEAQLPVQQITAVAVIINEAVSNAIKYAPAGDIQVSFAFDGSKARLIVADEGPGFPSNFDPTMMDSTGIELIGSLTAMDLRGTVHYENRPEGGASVIIAFPLSTVQADERAGEAGADQ